VSAGVLRVANCSGFFGDRAGAAKEMVEGGPVDVLTGDWLAELTMYILHKTRERSGGYARTFLRELEDVLPACVERGITVVANAGGLAPDRLADAVREVGRRQGVAVRVASVSGDDITARLGALRAAGERFVNLDTGETLPPDATVVTANAYLRARPIADALAAGAQVVVTGRVTDAALVVGPALHAFGWSDAEHDAIAGAVVAGHVIECGAQCCGGNYAFFEEVPGRARIGFPLAELYDDGSSVVTKHPGTGGLVSVGTVTAQLLYEIGGPRYLSPDAVARFDSIRLSQEGPDRVRIGAVRGEPPPATLKVTANLDAGWRNAMTLALTGSEVAAKARFAADAVWAGIPGGRGAFAETAEDLSGDVTGDGMAYLRLAVRGDDERSVGRAFSGAVVETSLSSYPGTFFTSAPSGAQGVARYWPTTVAASAVTPVVMCDGSAVAVTPSDPDGGGDRGVGGDGGTADGDHADAHDTSGAHRTPGALDHEGERVRVRLGVLLGARSGDKGGDANVGLWADEDAVASWLHDDFDVARFRALLPEADGCEVRRYALPNLRAVNFVVRGFLGWGVASNLRPDSQAKGLGELLRSRELDVPVALVASGRPATRLARASSSPDLAG
jgi:Acyclic terpene utilisation family protein AtuA